MDDDLPVIEAPFVALVDTNDEDWSEVRTAHRLGKRLLAAGCRYFVCFGPRSEEVHDYLDDLIVEEECHDVTTTFHDDESPEEVADFVLNCAAGGMKSVLVFVRRMSEWRRILNEAGGLIDLLEPFTPR